MHQIDNQPRQVPSTGWDVRSSLAEKSLQVPFADEARETRGTYLQNRDGNKTKTSNAAIQDAAYQIALATAAIWHEEAVVSNELASLTSPPIIPWRRQLLLPAIVTTAKLFICDFAPCDVDVSTGEIPFGKTTLTEKPYLIYEYAIPRHLQSRPSDLLEPMNTGREDWFTNLRIVVVQSKNFAQLLADLSSLA